MNSLPNKAVDSFDWATSWRGWWILVVWIAIYFAALSQTFEQVVSGILGGTEFRVSSDPPFYFIHEDVIKGICAAVGLLAAFAFTCVTWNYSPIYSHMVQWMSILFCGPHALPALYVWLRCDALFTPNARCPWPTFDSYLDDPWRMIATYLPMGVGVVYGAWGSRKFSKRHSQSLFNQSWTAQGGPDGALRRPGRGATG